MAEKEYKTEYFLGTSLVCIGIGRGDKLENFDLFFSPLLKHGRGY